MKEPAAKTHGNQRRKKVGLARLIPFGGRMLACRFAGRVHPLLVQFSVTNRCNAHCTYCYATYYERPPKDLDFAQVQKVIAELAGAGTLRLNMVGGEPLLRPDLGAIIEYAQSKGILCAMTTNGILVPRHMEMVKNLDMVCLSLDGQRKGNDINRGEGSFDKIMQAAEACIAQGVRLQLSAVLTRHTVDDVDFLVGLAEKLKCRVGFAPLISNRREGRDSGVDCHPSSESLTRSVHRIIELKKEGKPILFAAEAYEHLLRWPDSRRDIVASEELNFSPPPCYAGRCFCLVDYNADLYPCPQLVGLTNPGNILRDGLRSALRRAANHSCRACSVPCSVDFNMFFGLRPQVLRDHLQSEWKA